jgi:hypothetical protein
MERLKTLSTFLAGVIVGGGAVYLSPAQPNAVDPAIPPMGTANPAFLPAPTEGGLPGQAPQPGTLPPGATPPAGDAGPAPTPGLLPGSPPMGTAPPGMEPAAPPPTTPDGAAPAGPPLPAAATPAGPPPSGTAAAPADRPSQSGSRLETHLRGADAAWKAALERARGGSAAAKALAPDVVAHISGIPKVTDHMPPLQEMAAYLAASKVLLDRLASAGVDVRDLKGQIELLMRPPRGEVPGGETGSEGQRRSRAPNAGR